MLPDICHITAVGSGDPSSVLSPIIHQLFRSEGPLYRNGDSRPRILWSVVFSINQQAASEDLPLNVAVFPTIDSSVEYSSVIHSVREAFGRFWPDVDFLPRRLENVDDEECAENDESITEQRDENSLVDGGDSRSNYRSAMLRSEPVMLGDGGQLSSNMEVDGDRTNQRLSQDAPINS
ncbi:hypothetical protein AB6A40_009887 [Gnathostoma spinigerum]|uniref:RAE1/2 domain-containing protein n=1 Tax=Gnathostoma spinigerum TaxID=75299 RepID=A0ABD6ETN2_9BILA